MFIAKWINLHTCTHTDVHRKQTIYRTRIRSGVKCTKGKEKLCVNLIASNIDIEVETMSSVITICVHEYMLVPSEEQEPGGSAVVRRPAPPACPLYLDLAVAAALTSTSLLERCSELCEPEDLELAGTEDKVHTVSYCTMQNHLLPLYNSILHSRLFSSSAVLHLHLAFILLYSICCNEE